MKRSWLRISILALILMVAGIISLSAQQRVGQGMISPGQSRQTTLYSGQEQVWTLQISSGQQVTIDMERIDSSIDPYLELLSANGGEITTNDDGGSGLNSRISTYLNAGQYQIITREFGRDDTGQYRLTVTGQGGGGGQAGGIPIQIGQTIDSYITNGTPQNFILTVPTAQQVRIDHRRGQDRNIDPYLHLRDQYGNDIETNDDGGDGLNSRITRFLQPGTYQITARDLANNDSGAFQLQVTGLGGGQTPPQGIPIQIGQTLDSYINSGQVQRYTLNITSGQQVQIDVMRGEDRNVDPYLILQDQYGNEIETDDDGGSGFNSRITRFLQPGLYTIIGRDLGNNDSGAIRVAVTSMQQVMETGIPITVGQAIDSYIVEGQEQNFILELQQAQQVVITFDRGDGSGIDPLLEVYDTYGTQVARDDDGGSGLNSRVSQMLQPGRYRIVARDLSNNDAGAFRIQVLAGAIANAIPINIGQGYDGYINGGQSFVYRLEVSGTRTVTIDFMRTGSSNLDPYLILSNAGGGQISTNDDGGSGLDSRIQTTLNSGTYLIEVRDRTGSNSGSYRVQVN